MLAHLKYRLWFFVFGFSLKEKEIQQASRGIMIVFSWQPFLHLI